MNSDKVPVLPDKWSRWRIIDEIGSGTDGCVYKAIHEDGRIAAIKILPGEDNLPEAGLLEKLKDCPGIVKIYDTASEQGKSFILMEYLEPLLEKIYREPLTEPEIIRHMMEIAKILSELERRKIIHRDIKPENILLDANDSCVLCDVDRARQLTDYDQSLSIQGSFAYMAPEVYYGKKYNHRADLYSLGMVFYRCCNNQKSPFLDPTKRFPSREDREHALRQRMNGTLLPPPANASEELASILLRLCSPFPELRYPNAKALQKDLTLLIEGKYHSRRSFFAGWSLKKRVLALGMAVFTLVAAAEIAAYQFWLHSPMVPETTWADGADTCFTINHAGTAVFSGQGSIDGFTVPEQWNQYVSQVKKLIVKGDIQDFSLSMCDMMGLEELKLEEGVESLSGSSQFAGCRSLKKVTLPSTLTSIGDVAFAGCTSLKSITLPENLSQIPANCFFDCYQLRDINLPANVSSVGAGAFSGTLWLDSLVKEGNGFGIVGDILIAVSDQKGRVEIPSESGIRLLAAGSFRGQTAMEEIIIPQGVEVIETGCFEYCQSLEKVTLPDSLKMLDDYAFRGCVNLEEVQLGDQVDVSAADIFSETRYLEELTDKDGFAILNGTLIAYSGEEAQVVIPENRGIHTIGKQVFWTNENIERVVIPEGVQSIKQQAFFMCTNLKQVTIPESLKEIGPGAFAGAIWQPE